MKTAIFYALGIGFIGLAALNRSAVAKDLPEVSAAVSQKQKMKPAAYSIKMLNAYSGFKAPTGIAIDDSGNMYVSNWSGGTVSKIDK